MKKTFFERNIDTVVSVGEKNFLYIWDYNLGTLITKLATKHMQPITCLIEVNDEILATGSNDKTIKIWYLPKGKNVMNHIGHVGKVLCMDGIDEKRIISGGEDGMVKIWEINKVKEVSSFKGHELEVSGVKKINEKTIASCSYDESVKVWDIVKNKKILELGGHKDWIRSIETFTFDKKPYLVSCSSDKTVKVWSLNDRKCITTFEGHESAVTAISVYQNEKIISGDSNGNLFVWDFSSGKNEINFKAHEGWVNKIITQQKGMMDLILTCSEDKSIKVWELDGSFLSSFTKKMDSFSDMIFLKKWNAMKRKNKTASWQNLFSSISAHDDDDLLIIKSTSNSHKDGEKSDLLGSKKKPASGSLDEELSDLKKEIKELRGGD